MSAETNLALLDALSVAELDRLDVALTSIGAAPGSKINLAAVIGALRRPEAPAVPGTQRWRDEMDQGRGYQLLLLGLNDEEAERQHADEWRRVEAMVANGMSYQRAWERIRRDDWRLELENAKALPDEGRRRASSITQPVARPGPGFRLKRRIRSQENRP